MDPTAPIACIGAGTGLGEVFLTPSGDGLYEAWASEGGHVEFAPHNQLEFELLLFLQKKFKGRVSIERIASGMGLVNVYEFLRQKFPDQIVEEHDALILGEATEGAKHIGALMDKDRLCMQSMELMVASYGSEAGNLGLNFLPYGGLYIAGGIAVKILKLIEGHNSKFMKNFRDKGRVSGALDNIPVKVVTAPDLGMRGAHVVAARNYHKRISREGVSPSLGVQEKVEQEFNIPYVAIGVLTLAVLGVAAVKMR